MQTVASGSIRKMLTHIETPVQYQLPIGDQTISMNPLIGRTIGLRFLNEIRCVFCNRKTNKSFNQGYCFPCLRRLARCDGCMVKPETCHIEAGTCREPEWAETHCLIDHTVYLSNTGKAKVGITRGGNENIRWVDQGATQALAILTVPTRHQSGLAEVALKAHVGDRTNWRQMLSGTPEDLDLVDIRDTLFSACSEPLPGSPVTDSELTRIQYPVLEYPEKVKSISIEKVGTAEGTLLGIKGQYLILDSGVINVRKYGGYFWELSAD